MLCYGSALALNEVNGVTVLSSCRAIAPTAFDGLFLRLMPITADVSALGGCSATQLKKVKVHFKDGVSDIEITFQ